MLLRDKDTQQSSVDDDRGVKEDNKGKDNQSQILPEIMIEENKVGIHSKQLELLQAKIKTPKRDLLGKQSDIYDYATLERYKEIPVLNLGEEFNYLQESKEVVDTKPELSAIFDEELKIVE